MRWQQAELTRIRLKPWLEDGARMARFASYIPLTELVRCFRQDLARFLRTGGIRLRCRNRSAHSGHGPAAVPVRDISLPPRKRP